MSIFTDLCTHKTKVQTYVKLDDACSFHELGNQDKLPIAQMAEVPDIASPVWHRRNGPKLL